MDIVSPLMTQASPLLSSGLSNSGQPHDSEAATIIKHVAHELRQPLSTIESIAFFLEMILPATETKALEQIAKLQDLVEQANGVLGDAIHVLQAVPPRPVELDLNSLVSRCYDEQFYYCESFRMELADALPKIYGDVHQFDHLVRTLFSLITRSTNPGAPVTFRTSAADGDVRLEISCGLNHVTQMSLRALTSSFQVHRNVATGLAYASAQRIAEVHGGRIDVQARGEMFSLRVTFPAL
jgi:signal transduction histidine kinase